MTILKPRSRMISIRLSDEEYSALRRFCFVTGARSISDLAREAMNALLRGAGREDGSGISAADLRTQIRDLDRKVEQISAQIASSHVESTP